MTGEGILAFLRQKQWASFARRYNGSGQVVRYSAWLRDAYARARTVFA